MNNGLPGYTVQSGVMKRYGVTPHNRLVIVTKVFTRHAAHLEDIHKIRFVGQFDYEFKLMEVEILKGKVVEQSLGREQLLTTNMHRVLRNLIRLAHRAFENFNFHELELVIELAYEADFMDVFQVRGVARENLGHYYQPIVRRDSITFHYSGLDRVARETIIHLSPEPESVDGTTARWKLRLPPFKRFQLHTTVVPQVAGKRSRSVRPDFA